MCLGHMLINQHMNLCTNGQHWYVYTCLKMNFHNIFAKTSLHWIYQTVPHQTFLLYGIIMHLGEHVCIMCMHLCTPHAQTSHPPPHTCTRTHTHARTHARTHTHQSLDAPDIIQLHMQYIPSSHELMNQLVSNLTLMVLASDAVHLNNEHYNFNN